MLKNFIRVFLAGYLCFGFYSPAMARLTGTSTEPETCWGASGAEVCVDSTGDWVPTTDSVDTLGLSTLRWANVYSVLGNFSGALTVTGATSLNGTVAVGDVHSDTFTINSSTAILNARSGISLSSSTTAVPFFQVDGATAGGAVYIRTATDIDDAINSLRAGALCYDATDKSMCMSTGTGTGAWVLLSTPVAPCPH